GRSTLAASYNRDRSAGTWQIITTAALAAGYGGLDISYLVRYAVLIVLAVTARFAGLLFMLPETDHLAKMWATHFTTSLYMQPAQLFVLSIGFALVHDGISHVHNLYAIASMLFVFKLPGALGGAEKASHKLESIVH